MTDHTTIQITKAQAEELQDRKTHDDESYKSVIARLLEGDSLAITHGEVETAADAEEIAEQVMNELSMANDPGVEVDIDELINRIERLESAVKEATEAAQSAENKLEDLQR